MGVVGERDAVLAFKALGMRVIAVSTLKKRRKRSTACTARHSRHFSDGDVRAAGAGNAGTLQDRPEVRRHPDSGQQRCEGFGLNRVKANVEKAIGADILFNNEKEGT